MKMMDDLGPVNNLLLFFLFQVCFYLFLTYYLCTSLVLLKKCYNSWHLIYNKKFMAFDVQFNQSITPLLKFQT